MENRDAERFAERPADQGAGSDWDSIRSNSWTWMDIEVYAYLAAVFPAHQPPKMSAHLTPFHYCEAIALSPNFPQDFQISNRRFDFKW